MVWEAVIALALAIAVSCFCSMLVAILAAVRLASRLDRLERRYRDLFVRHTMLKAEHMPKFDHDPGRPTLRRIK